MAIIFGTNNDEDFEGTPSDDAAQDEKVLRKATESRRKLLGLAAAGVGLGVATALPPAAQAAEPGLFASWVHGHNVVLERGVFAISKAGVFAAFRFAASQPFPRGFDGDVVAFSSSGALAVSRLGSGAQFVVFDYGSQDRPKTGRVWCHYAVPTPVIVEDRRARLIRVLVDQHAQEAQQLAIVAVHVWDGGNSIARFDNIVAMPSGLFIRDLPDVPVLRGMGVSLLIGANNAKNVKLDINAVGVDFLA
jgi:hypothetical protein